MKRTLLACVGLLTLAVAAQPVEAADLPAAMPVKAPVVAPVFNWSGFYVGGNVGYGWGRNTGAGFDSFTDPGFAPDVEGYFAEGGNVLPGVKPEGVIGGAQIGYDWQYSPHGVAGLVADLQASDMSDSASATVDPPNFVETTQSNSAKIKWFGTVRAKIGYAADNWLIYATGGLAYGRVKTDIVFDWPSATPPFLFAGSKSRTKAGWTVGGGLQYGLASNWTLGLEYLYFDLGKVSTTATATLSPVTVTAESKFAGHIVRAVLNYRFGGAPPPITASY